MQSAVVLAADEQFVLGTAAVLTSLATHAELEQLQARVILLRPGPPHPTASDRILLRLGERLGLDFELRPISPRNDRLPDPCARQTNWRVLDIPDTCREIGRAVYLDADVLVLSSLRDLFSLDLSDKAAAAVADLPAHPTLGTPGVLDEWQERDRYSDQPYFNSGVLVMDLEACRSSELGRRAEEFAVRHPALRFGDQDALNVALVGRWLALDPRWNVDPNFTGTDDATRGAPGGEEESYVTWQTEARIWHFMGRPKPWHVRFPRGEVHDRYFTYIPAQLRRRLADAHARYAPTTPAPRVGDVTAGPPATGR